MNTTFLSQLLFLRVQDDKSVSFSPDVVVKALNNAQDQLCQKIRFEYLTALEVIDSNKEATNGEYAISSLVYDPLHGSQGILKVKIYGGAYCTRINITDMKKRESTYLAGSANNPLWWVKDNKIYVSNGTTSPSIDIYYLKQPAPMMYMFTTTALSTPAKTGFLGAASQGLSAIDDTYNGVPVYTQTQGSIHIVTDYDAEGNVEGDICFTVSPDAAANFGTETMYFLRRPDLDALSVKQSATDTSLYVESCELNMALLEIIMSYAEAQLFGMASKIDKRDNAKAMADLIVQTLNDNYIPPAGIGTRLPA